MNARMNMNGKSDLFRIGEIARLFHVSISTLRHYDKLGLVSPECVDPQTGYRYYSTRQFERLNTIRYLRELDVPLERIQGFIENRKIDGMRSMLQQQRDEVIRRQEELARVQRKIENRLAQIDKATHVEMDHMAIERVPARRIALLRKSFAVDQALDLEIHIRELEKNEKRTAIFLGKVGIGLSKESLEARRFHPYEVMFIVLDDEDSYEGDVVVLPEETCAVVWYQGSHERAPHYYEMLLDFIRENQWHVVGFSKEITMVDYGLTNDETEFVTEIQIPIARQMREA